MSHLEKYGNPGSGKESYLSSTVYEEILLLMAKGVKDVILTELKDAKYFSVSVDSTPDLTHTDQLTVMIRYVVSGRSVEQFLTFLQPKSHKAEDLTNTLLELRGSCRLFRICTKTVHVLFIIHLAVEYSGRFHE